MHLIVRKGSQRLTCAMHGRPVAHVLQLLLLCSSHPPHSSRRGRERVQCALRQSASTRRSSECPAARTLRLRRQRQQQQQSETQSQIGALCEQTQSAEPRGEQSGAARRSCCCREHTTHIPQYLTPADLRCRARRSAQRRRYEATSVPRALR